MKLYVSINDSLCDFSNRRGDFQFLSFAHPRQYYIGFDYSLSSLQFKMVGELGMSTWWEFPASQYDHSLLPPKQ